MASKRKKILDHIHKLKRIKYTNGEAIYFCINGSCEYEINVKKALGKPNECHRCGKEFDLNEQSIRLAKPHCLACTKYKDEVVDSSILNLSIPPMKSSTVQPKSTAADSLRERLQKSISSVLSSTATDEDLL